MNIGSGAPVACAAGSRECWEAFASERAALARYEALKGKEGGWPGLKFAELIDRADEGDPAARAALSERVSLPLQAAGGEVLETVRVVLGTGGNLEASARALFVHTNTVRYRLKRAAELTGYSATDPRGAWTLQLALAFAELDGDRSLWH
jgi:DNA-binding PucR family transcriptional regulator